MGCKWCLKSGSMNCPHQCVLCFISVFRTECECNETKS